MRVVTIVLGVVIASCSKPPAPAPARPPVEVLPRDEVCRSELVLVHVYALDAPADLVDQLHHIAPAFVCFAPNTDPRHPKQKICSLLKKKWCNVQHEIPDELWRQIEALGRHPSVAAVLPGHIK